MSTENVHKKWLPWFIWAIAVVFVVYLFNAQTVYAVLSPVVQKELNLSIDQIALVASTYTWVFAVAQIFGGAMLDRLGSKKVIVPAIVFTTLGVTMFGLANSFGFLLLSQLVIAIGSSVGFVGAGYVGGRWFGMAKFGVMFGFVQVVASLMSAIGEPSFSLALEHFNWRTIFLFGGVCGLGLAVIAFFFIRDPIPPVASKEPIIGSLFKNIGEVLKVPHVWISAAWAAIVFGAQLALGVVWAPRLMEAHGVTTNDAVYATAAVWLGLAIGCLFWNGWSDKIQSRKIPSVVGNVIQLIALAGLMYLDVNFMLGLIVLFAFGMGNSSHIIAFTTAAEAVPPRLIGTSAAVVNGIMFVVGGIFIDLPGRLLPELNVTLSNYQNAFLPILILLVVAVILSALMKETFAKVKA